MFFQSTLIPHVPVDEVEWFRKGIWMRDSFWTSTHSHRQRSSKPFAQPMSRIVPPWWIAFAINERTSVQYFKFPLQQLPCIHRLTLAESEDVGKSWKNIKCIKLIKIFRWRNSWIDNIRINENVPNWWKLKMKFLKLQHNIQKWKPYQYCHTSTGCNSNLRAVEQSQRLLTWHTIANINIHNKSWL